MTFPRNFRDSWAPRSRTQCSVIADSSATSASDRFRNTAGGAADRLLDQRKRVLRKVVRGVPVLAPGGRSVEQDENRHLLAEVLEHDRHLLGDDPAEGPAGQQVRAVRLDLPDPREVVLSDVAERLRAVVAFEVPARLQPVDRVSLGDVRQQA
jgi:hypothetical protein